MRVTETRQYNARSQLTRMTMTGMDLGYVYSATQNDGRIDRMKNWTTSEHVNYQYDSLRRLSAEVARARFRSTSDLRS
jgi:hypothetical protein